MKYSTLQITELKSSQTAIIKDITSLSKSFKIDPSSWYVIGPQAAPIPPGLEQDLDSVPNEAAIVLGGEPALTTLWSNDSAFVAGGLGCWEMTLIHGKILANLASERYAAPFAVVLSRHIQEQGASLVTWSRDVSPGMIRSAIPEEESLASDELRHWLRSLDPSDLIRNVADPVEAKAVKAGLLLWHDFLEESHSISQSIEGEGKCGDYWHAIMHRREPDFGNSRYWFRRVGAHPVFTELRDRAVQLANEFDTEQVHGWLSRLTARGWDSCAAIDLFEEVHASPQHGTPLHTFAERLQAIEMLLLLRFSVEAAS